MWPPALQLQQYQKMQGTRTRLPRGLPLLVTLVGLSLTVIVLLSTQLLWFKGGGETTAFGSWSGVPNTAHQVTWNDIQSQDDRSNAMRILTALPKLREAPHNDEYKIYTESRLRALAMCLGAGNCHPNALKIMIMASKWCHATWYGQHWDTGEGVWCRGMYDSLERQGYTVLNGGDGDIDYVKYLHRQLGDLVKVVVGDDDGRTYRSIADHFKTRDRPDGLPAWKYFRYSYWPSNDATVVGEPWVITAEPHRFDQSDKDYNNFTYIGYTMNPVGDMKAMPHVPWEERDNRVWILGKWLHYFYPELSGNMVGVTNFSSALPELEKEFPGFKFVGGWFDNRHDQDKAKIPLDEPEGITNLGKLNATQFDIEVSKSKLMLGLGWPTISPSPYRAIAMGVPFSNPFATDRHMQHTGLYREGTEPYVYMMRRWNYTSFVETIRKALQTPVHPYTFERMKPEAVDERIRWLMDTDWRGEAQQILDARISGHETQHHPQNKLGYQTFEM